MTEFDHVVQEGEMYQDEDETNKTKVEGKNGLEKYCVATENTVTEEKLNFKCEAGGKEKPEKALQSAGNWSDKSLLGENDEFEAQHKELDRTDRVINVPVPTQPQVPIVQRVETTVGGPKMHSISEVMDAPAVKQRRVSTAMQTARKTDQTVEVAKVIPHERILKPAGERASVRERVRQFEMNGDMSCTSTVEVPRATPDGRQSEDPEDEAPNKRRKQESDPDSRAPVHFSLCDGSSDQETKSVEDPAKLETRPEGEREGFPVGQLDDVLLKVRDVKSELLQVRELVGDLVRRERCAEVKTEVAARRLDRMEREKDDADDAEREANFQEALTDQSKVVKLIVDKWFVDKGFGFGRTTTGEVVFIHASVVQGAEVLMVGTDAWAQVVSDHARAEGRYRARRAWGRNAWRQERDKEKANQVAQQVRRAAALTAELAAQSEKKTAAVCDQPPGLDELAGHIEAPHMGAGGSHPQATMMPDPWATYSRPSASENQAETSAPPETSSIPANRRPFASRGGFRGARPRSATRAQSTHPRGSKLDGRRSAAKKTHRTGAALLYQEEGSVGVLQKAAKLQTQPSRSTLRKSSSRR